MAKKTSTTVKDAVLEEGAAVPAPTRDAAPAQDTVVIQDVPEQVAYAEFFENISQGCAEVIENLIKEQPSMRMLGEQVAYDLVRLARACKDEGI